MTVIVAPRTKVGGVPRSVDISKEVRDAWMHTLLYGCGIDVHMPTPARPSFWSCMRGAECPQIKAVERSAGVAQ